MINQQGNPDLDTVTTSEMLAEIKKRFDAFVFAGIKDMDINRVRYFTEWRGAEVSALGLAEYLSTKIRRNLAAQDHLVEEADSAEDMEEA